MGDELDIYLFCDKDNWEAVSPFIQGIIEQEVLLVYPEKYFNLIPKDISEYPTYAKYRNLMFIGDLESSGKVSKHMRESLAGDFITRVQQSGGDLFVAKNYATRDQLILYLLASNPLNLKKVAVVQAKRYMKPLATLGDETRLSGLPAEGYPRPLLGTLSFHHADPG